MYSLKLCEKVVFVLKSIFLDEPHPVYVTWMKGMKSRGFSPFGWCHGFLSDPAGTSRSLWSSTRSSGKKGFSRFDIQQPDPAPDRPLVYW